MMKNKNLKTGYNVPYWWYDIRGFFIFKLSYQDSLISTVNFFSKNYSDSHLEVAVGSGSFMNLCLKFRQLFRKPKSSGVAFDYTDDMLKGARSLFQKNQSWSIEQADVTQMQYSKELFKTINIANAFHCFSDPKKSAIEISRVLAPNGSVVVNILTPARGSKLMKKIAHKLVSWGQKTKILEAPIDRNSVINIFKNAGLHVIEEQWNGNNLLLKLTKPIKKYTHQKRNSLGVRPQKAKEFLELSDKR